MVNSLTFVALLSSSFSILLFLPVTPSLALRANYDGDDQALAPFIHCLEKKSYKSNYPILDVIYTRRNTSYEEVLLKRVKNKRYKKPTTPKPLLIIAPKSELNIPAIVTCARINGVKIKTRSGGHDFEGLSYWANFPFVLLDMFNLNAVDVNIADETAWVQSGATLGEIYYRIAEKSNVHAFPAGVCPNVGAGGHFSGGGYGNLMRKYGLSVDNIVDARVVDANGRILDREGMGEDFFWAIRGGGGSSFGVILAWKLKLVRVPPKVTVFSKDFVDVSAPGITHILYKWQYVSRELPKDLLIRVESQVYQNPVDGKFKIWTSFLSMFLGDTESLLQIVDEKFPELGLTREDCTEMAWIDSVLFWDRAKNTSREFLLNYPDKSPYNIKIKGDFVKKPIPEEELPKIWDKITETGVLYMEWTPYGGRMDEIESTAVPFPHRKGNSYMIFYSLMWSEDDMTDHLNKTRELYDFMETYVSYSPREGFLNYIDLDLKVSGEKYFLHNFPKLVAVKTRVDPTNFFSHEQSIPTAYQIEENKRGYYNI